MKVISDSPENEIERLNQKLIPLKEERHKLNLEAKKLAEKRNAIHEKTRNLRKEATNIKEKRDSLNEKVQKLKKLRDQTKIRRQEKRDKISELQEKIRALNKKKTEGTILQVERNIEEIDWKIQTTSLPLKIEQTLVNRVKQLEAQLSVKKQIKKLKDKLLDLRDIEKSLGSEVETLHRKLSELAKQSQKFHEQMCEALNQARKFQVEADGLHQKYLETKEQTQIIHQKCVEVVEKIKKIKQGLKAKAEKKQAERQIKIQRELERRALAKLKRGEKLIWEEFQILAEKGML